MRWNGHVDLLNVLHITLNAVIYDNELALNPFSLFNIKCKKLNLKNLWKCSFRTLREGVFHIFLSLQTIMEGAPISFRGCTHTHRVFVDLVTIFSSSSMRHLRWTSIWQKMVIAENFVLNVTPTLKHKDKFWLKQ